MYIQKIYIYIIDEGPFSNVENAILQTLGVIHGPQNRQFILERNDRNGACRYAPFLDQPSMLAHYTEPSSHW